VFEARICLEADPANRVNAFKWSSSLGPPRPTEAGTTCSASVVVEERKPYTYVIPAVRKSVGL
jgi:HlyD family secretion protein